MIDNIEETLMDALDKAMTCDNPIQNLNNVLLAHLAYAKERRETSFIIIMGAMQFSDSIIREKISLLLQKLMVVLARAFLKIEHGVHRQDSQMYRYWSGVSRLPNSSGLTISIDKNHPSP